MKNIGQVSGLSLANRDGSAENKALMAGINVERKIDAFIKDRTKANLAAPKKKKKSFLKLFRGKMFVLYLQAIEIFYIIYS
ncbi:MAG TPA: hypothetical protein VGM63_05910 [Mucilaginibacter sp.]|jgi:hypothetical protein